jgi:membrane fusion protein, multidrug efflux system
MIRCLIILLRMNEAVSEAAQLPTDKPATRVAARQIVVWILAVLAIAVGAYFGVRHWNFAMSHEETDDAQVEGHISPVLPRVPGYVARVLVDDNQRVAAGQP